MSTPTLHSPAFCIVPATEHDLLEIVEIEEACALSPWGWNGYHQELTQEKSAFMFVARLPAASGEWPQVGGFITSRLVADEVHIHNYGVRPALRRQGLGGALLRAALAYGAAQGAVSSFLEVRAGNLAAQAVYQRQGFAVVGRRKNYYDHPPEDAVTMMLARLSL
jgi:[ribosomal protein S18]-alanine N-acetyltransferase